MNNFYITTPIYYANDLPHIGHAYTSIMADCIKRFKILDGYNVISVTGSDEHGSKIAETAKIKGFDVRKYVDDISVLFRNLAQVTDCQFDDFIRTTEPRHYESARELWNMLKANDMLYKGLYSGWYARRDEAFYTDSEIKDGKVITTGAEVEWMEEETWFFKLSLMSDRLIDFYDNNPDFIYPSYRMNEVRSFVKQGLRDLAVSRSVERLSWGIPLPDDDNSVMYVWLDALTNYLTVLGFPNKDNQLYKNYWLDSNCDNLHVIGKDIIIFHAVYWPAFLMAAGLPLPKKILAHGWWLNDGQKISKSLGNVINPIDLIEQYGSDYLRYFLMREVSVGNDGNFNHELFKNRINSELVNGFGNMIRRCSTIVNKHFNGSLDSRTIASNDIKSLFDESIHKVSLYRKSMNTLSIDNAIGHVVDIFSSCNFYISKVEPWNMIKQSDKREDCANVMHAMLLMGRLIALLLSPFIPKGSKDILDFLCTKDYMNIDDFINENFADQVPEIRIDESKLGIPFPRL